jgi:hypothetical protein
LGKIAPFWATLTSFLLNQFSPKPKCFNSWFVVGISRFQPWFDANVWPFKLSFDVHFLATLSKDWAKYHSKISQIFNSKPWFKALVWIKIGQVKIRDLQTLWPEAAFLVVCHPSMNKL